LSEADLPIARLAIIKEKYSVSQRVVIGKKNKNEITKYPIDGNKQFLPDMMGIKFS